MILPTGPGRLGSGGPWWVQGRKAARGVWLGQVCALAGVEVTGCGVLKAGMQWGERGKTRRWLGRPKGAARPRRALVVRADLGTARGGWGRVHSPPGEPILGPLPRHGWRKISLPLPDPGAPWWPIPTPPVPLPRKASLCPRHGAERPLLLALWGAPASVPEQVCVFRGRKWAPSCALTTSDRTRSGSPGCCSSWQSPVVGRPEAGVLPG